MIKFFSSLSKNVVMHQHLAAAIVSACLAGLLLWPMPICPDSCLVGHPGNDTWNHVWGYWWVDQALRNGEWPQNASLLAWPGGGSLYFIDTIQAVLSWPVQLLMGPVVAFNLVIWFQLALCGFSAYLLAARLTGDGYAAFFALLFFEMSPHILGQAYNGISETICAGWFPLTLWALLRLMERPEWKSMISLGLIAAMCVLTSWYYGLFAILGSLILLLWSLIRQSWLYDWKKIIPGMIGSGAITLAITLAPFLAFQRSLDASDALVSRDPEFVELSLLNHNITDLLAFFRLSDQPSPDLFSLYGEELIIVIYLGWTGMLLMFLALWSARQYREISPYIWIGMIFWIFSLGPWLNIDGDYVQLLGRRVPLPFLPLYKLFPVFDRISHPFRFVVGVSLAIAVLASHGFRIAFRRRTSRQKSLFLLVLGMIMWVEYSLFSPAQLPVPISDANISDVYHQMKQDPNPGAVLELPLTVPNLERAIYVWNQSAHHRPVPWGLNEPMPQVFLKNRLTQTLIQIEGNRARKLPSILPELDLVVATRALARQGFRYIVVHEKMYPRFKLRQVRSLLQALIGDAKRYPDEHLMVFSLSGPGELFSGSIP